MKEMPRSLIWFSCGAASAVAAHMCAKRENSEILYCPVANEHPDNMRFLEDVSKWIGREIKLLRSTEFPSMDIYDVFKKRNYIVGVQGASCTYKLKRQLRMDYQRDDDIHVFGYTTEEAGRIESFEKNNPLLRCDWVLRDAGISKKDCYRIVQEAGIRLPEMYLLGYNNNNCIGCVKGGAGYWNKIRKDFPHAFNAMAHYSKNLGVKLIRHKGERIFLKDLPTDAGNYKSEPDIECGPQCVMPVDKSEAFDGKLLTN